MVIIWGGTQYSYNWGNGGLNYVKGIAHRGYNKEAPENSLEAYKQAADNGFLYVETDLAVTKDGVYVLSHDPTINRCARTSEGAILSRNVYIKDLYYKNLRKYDFGIIKGTKYKGMEITKFVDFLDLCKEKNLHPYIELKASNTPEKEQVVEIMNLVKKRNMQNNVTWISFSDKLLEYVNIPGARKGYLTGSPIDDKKLSVVKREMNRGYDMFIDIGYNYNPTNEEIKKCVQNNIKIEVWTVDSLQDMKKYNTYISGITSNVINASSELYKP